MNHFGKEGGIVPFIPYCYESWDSGDKSHNDQRKR